ncbi:pyridoxal phosphate-dependent aminotransferase [Metabacillus sp. GX 13764]|uniref:MalY/PatB family protein n=1 Tax=Metabacillus kandeliae TaxID=2900151 RepID=UPI001E2F6436|nr:MalY/PatB family protein [Metabacillus kandeliae]MCD7035748.1 pyridoxal phosphate-dependent aminotransferase [Metabacillus kandeliae]
MDIFQKQIIRTETGSVKWDRTKEVFGTSDVLPMWVADMDFEAPQEVKKALVERVEHGVFGYTFPNAAAKEAIMKWTETRHQWKISSEEAMLFSSGVVTALSVVIQALTEKGDKVLLQSPVYTPFFTMIEENERVVENSPLLLEDSRYYINFEDLESKLSQPEVKMMLICSPHNPSGRAWTEEELRQIGDLCIKHGVTAVSDEIHSDLMLFGKRHYPFASLGKEYAQQCITCIAPSKTFNLAGLQASAIITENKDFRDKIAAVQHKNGQFGLNAMAITAMKAAYETGSAWLDQLLVLLENHTAALTAFIEDRIPEIKVMKPDASYLIWLDCRGTGLSDQELKHQLLYKGKLALEPGPKYGSGGEGFVRINIGTPLATLQEGLLRLEKAFR